MWQTHIIFFRKIFRKKKIYLTKGSFILLHFISLKSFLKGDNTYISKIYKTFFFSLRLLPPSLAKKSFSRFKCTITVLETFLNKEKKENI